MSNVRKEELTRYVELLVHLKANGVRCDDKIEEALEELHKTLIKKANHTFSTASVIDGSGNIIASGGTINSGTIIRSGGITEDVSGWGATKQDGNPFDRFI